MSEKRFAQEIRYLFTNGIRNVSSDWTGLLDDGETLIGTPVVTEDSGLLTLSAPQVLPAAMLINGKLVGASLGVAFTVDRNGAAAGDYPVDIIVNTSAGQRIPGSVLIRCP